MKSLQFKNTIDAKVSITTLFVFLFMVTFGLILSEKFTTIKQSPFYEKQYEAATLMQNALEVIKKERIKRGFLIDLSVDVNNTGIIGDMVTSITTTAGNLTAKRTSANPDFAALMVKLLSKAGVKKKDTIAIGASGSFPALIIASLCATRAMDISSLIIYSIGSSAYGANIPEFTFIEMLDCLNKEKILPYQPIAISLGGENDKGIGIFGVQNRPDFTAIAQRSGFYYIDEPSLSKSIEKRMVLYREKAKNKPISAFINIGGASANFGNTPASLRLPNGIIIPGKTDRHTRKNVKGVIFSFLDTKTPVIHLLNIKDLAFANNIPIDPHPLPLIGESGVYHFTQYSDLLLLGTMLVSIITLLIGRWLFRCNRLKSNA